MSKVFLFLSGPYENVGDALIRRRALSWARAHGKAHVLLGGRRSPDWDASLELAQSDMIYRSRIGWIKAAVLNSGSKPLLVIEPGEFNTDKRFLRTLFVLLLVSVAIRVRGGSVVQMPRSMARASPVGKALYSLTIGRSSDIFWREEQSWISFRNVGTVVPDIGFDDPDSVTRTSGNRRFLAISLRSDRPELDLNMAGWLRQSAASLGLEIVAVSQVAEDDTRTDQLRKQLDCAVLLWGDQSSNSQERALRSIYDETALIWSDRLHVLVLGAMHGAVPLEIVVSPNGKIKKHFEAIGIDRISFDANGIATAVQLHDLLTSHINRSESVKIKVEAARRSLAAARASVRSEHAS